MHGAVGHGDTARYGWKGPPETAGSDSLQGSRRLGLWASGVPRRAAKRFFRTAVRYALRSAFGRCSAPGHCAPLRACPAVGC